MTTWRRMRKRDYSNESKEKEREDYTNVTWRTVSPWKTMSSLQSCWPRKLSSRRLRLLLSLCLLQSSVISTSITTLLLPEEDITN